MCVKPPLPSKPQSVIIERWLPYRQIKRRVIYVKASSNPANKDGSAVMVKPKNIIIQWEPPRVHIKKEFKDLGIVRANPVEYVQRYGTSLKRSIELPPFVKEIKPPDGVVLAADTSSLSSSASASQSQPHALYELEGDVYALNLVDLEREGLVEYRYLLRQMSGGSGSGGGVGAAPIKRGGIDSGIDSTTVVNGGEPNANPTTPRTHITTSSEQHTPTAAPNATTTVFSSASIGHGSRGSVSSSSSTSAELINELFKTLQLDVRLPL